MRAIVVDDEPIMLNSFLRLSAGIRDLQIAGHFLDPEEALRFAKNNPVELAFLDVKMPRLNGIELARKLREIRPDILIVFISAYDEYVRDSNQIGADYYIVKPYKKETLEMTMEKIRLLASRQKKDIFIHTFGRFSVIYKGEPVQLSGKAKEILAYLVANRGKEVSNEAIYETCWEGRAYSNDHMTVYYNALHRLKQALEKAGLSALLISNVHGQMVNTSLFDCDYYDWLDNNENGMQNRFEGEFLSEYSWGESMIGPLYDRLYGI